MAINTSAIVQPPPGGVVNIFTFGDPVFKIDDTISFFGYGFYKVVGVITQTPEGDGEYAIQRLTGNSTNAIPAGTSILTTSESLEHLTKNYSATTFLNFQEASYQSMVVTGDLTLAAQHHAPARSLAVRLINNNSVAKNLTFPGSWTFLGAKPATLEGDKTGVLSITCFQGSTGDDFTASDLDIIAVWATS